MKHAPSLPDIRPRPYLDHVMVLLDDAAHRDVLDSDFLGESFGRVKRKMADSSIAGSYSTLGLAGENTLVELFGGTIPGPVSRNGGLVFSFELPGSAQQARRLLAEEAGIASHHELVLRSVPDKTERQPWYHLLSADLGETSPLLLLLNEVRPEYFAALGASPGPGGELRRRDYLDAVLGVQPSAEHCLRDIVGVTVRLRANRVRRIATVLATLGYLVENRLDQMAVTGPGVEVVLVADELAPEGVLEIRMALTRSPHQPAVFRFGETSELTLETAGVARWSFTPIGPSATSAEITAPRGVKTR